MRILKLALRPWKLAPSNQLLGALSVGVLLTLGGALSTLYGSLGPAISRLRSEQILSVYASPKVVTREDELALVDSVRTAAGSAALTEVEWVGSDEFLRRIELESPALVEELRALGTERNAIVPRYVSLSGRFDDEDVGRIRAVPGVEAIDTSRDRHQGIIGAFAALRWVSLALLVGLAFALLTGLFHLARLNRASQADALSLLRMLGAGPDLLVGPLVLGGASIGLVGGLLAWISWWTVLPLFFGGIRSLSPALVGIVSPPAGIGVALLFAGVALGAFSGLLSARQTVHG